MIFPTLAYLDQARSLLFARSSRGFSATTCFLLIFANGLRCALGFYEGKTKPELLELGMDGLMLLPVLILSLLFSLSGSTKKAPGIESLTTFVSVIIIALLFVGEVVGGFDIKTIYTLVKDSPLLSYADTLYFPDAIVALETLAPIPQVLASLRAGSSSTLSSVLVLMRTVADAKRLYFYIINKAPQQLLISGKVQLGCSAVLLLQSYLSGSFLRLALRIPITAARVLAFFARLVKPKSKPTPKNTERPREVPKEKKEESKDNSKDEPKKGGLLSILKNPFGRRVPVEPILKDESKKEVNEEDPIQDEPQVEAPPKGPSFISLLVGRLVRLVAGTGLGISKRIVRLLLAAAFILAQTILIAGLSFLQRVKTAKATPSTKASIKDLPSLVKTNSSLKISPSSSNKRAFDNSNLMNRSVTFSV